MTEIQHDGTERRSSHAGLTWRRVLFGGGALWALSVVVTGVTGNFNLVPTVVLLGSFLVPVTAVVWYLDHYDSDVVNGRAVLECFVAGGVLGVLGASLLEGAVPNLGPLLYLAVGLVEELAKLLALVALAWRLPKTSVRDGIVLGAAVGFGFAALESSGYALTALFANASGGLSLGALVETEMIRGVLAPFGHGLWTAILGGVLFATSREGRFRLSGVLAVAYVAVSLLHALWDSMRGIAMLLTVIVTGTPLHVVATPQGSVIVPTAQQMHVFTILDDGGYAAISLVGLAWLIVLWRRSRRRDVESYARREVA